MTAEEISFFDTISDSWDQNEVLSTPDKIADIISYADIRKGMEVLDLGTGTGVLLPLLSGLTGKEGRVVAVDASEGMLDKAIAKYGDLENVSFIRLDFEAEKITGKFDRIILYCVYPHLHKPEATLKRLIAENLKKDGKITVAFPSDENFINNIHKERKAESDLLPSAPHLASIFSGWGLPAAVCAYDSHRYVVQIQS